jgi:hypothetical protein
MLGSTSPITTAERPALRQGAVAVRAGGARLGVLVPVFLVSLLIPAIFFIGDMRLSAYRLLLLLAAPPLFLYWASGRSGRLLSVDFLLLAYVGWSVLAVFRNHGLANIEAAGIYALEVTGAYMLGRTMIRGEAQFAAMARLVIVLVGLLVPIMAIESVTERRLINELFDPFTETFPDANMDPRWGLRRAQGPFEHPILAGVFASTAVAFALHLGGRAFGLVNLVKGGFVSLAVFFSLSAGAFLPVLLQLGLTAWERVTRSFAYRWRILIAGVLSALVAVTVITGRSPFVLVAAYLTFDADTAWGRINVFIHGIDDVMNNPVFGIGFNDWSRPHWMRPSVDNFWLVVSMRYGLPALALLMTFIVVTMTLIGRNGSLSPEGVRQRYALIFGLVGTFVAAGTVHLWNATFVFVIFLLGAGVWMIEERPALARASVRAGPGAPRPAAEGRVVGKPGAPSTPSRRAVGAAPPAPPSPGRPRGGPPRAPARRA